MSKRRERVRFTNPHTHEVLTGEVVGKGVQPISGARITQLRVVSGQEKGLVYWVPDDVIDKPLDWLARL